MERDICGNKTAIALASNGIAPDVPQLGSQPLPPLEHVYTIV
jgi:hypothetical protein